MLTPACEPALVAVAPLMRELVFSEHARAVYDQISGAVIWSDEFPPAHRLRTVRNWAVIRFVFRFRTTLILGEPEEEYRVVWDRARELFPGWPGFDPRRCSLDQRPRFQELETKGNADLDKELLRYEELEGGS
jgi:hypothetical protein